LSPSSSLHLYLAHTYLYLGPALPSAFVAISVSFTPNYLDVSELLVNIDKLPKLKALGLHDTTRAGWYIFGCFPGHCILSPTPIILTCGFFCPHPFFDTVSGETYLEKLQYLKGITELDLSNNNFIEWSVPDLLQALKGMLTGEERRGEERRGEERRGEEMRVEERRGEERRGEERRGEERRGEAY
jgi:hypothetical protein